MILFAAAKSSTLRVVLVMPSTHSSRSSTSRVAVCVVAAFFVLVEVLVDVLSRVVALLAVRGRGVRRRRSRRRSRSRPAQLRNSSLLFSLSV